MFLLLIEIIIRRFDQLDPQRFKVLQPYSLECHYNIPNTMKCCKNGQSIKPRDELDCIVSARNTSHIFPNSPLRFHPQSTRHSVQFNFKIPYVQR